MRRFFPIFLLILFSWVAQPVMAQPEGEFGPWPFPESVDALPNNLQPGQPFQGFPNYQRSVDWMAVPQWLAGDWLSKDFRILKSYNHQTHTMYNIPKGNITPISDHFGDQMDRTGGVWNCNITPFSVQSPLGNVVDVQVVVGMKALKIENDYVELWQRILHAVVTPNQTIQDSFTEERVTQYGPSQNGMVQAGSSSRFYDVSGNASQSTQSVRFMRRTSPFTQSGQRNGVNLSASFYEFLQNTGRADLMPGTSTQ